MRRHRGGLADYERRLVVLQTRDGYSLRGAARVYEDCIVLAGCERVDTEKPVQLGGEVIVLRENVSFFQTITETRPVES